MGRPIRDLTGQVFTRLTVLGLAGHNRWQSAMWHCQCACGDLARVCSGDLLTGRTRSCGCLRVEASRARLTAWQAQQRATRAAGHHTPLSAT